MNIVIGSGLSAISAYKKHNCDLMIGKGIIGGTASSTNNKKFLFDKGIHVLNTIPENGIGCNCNNYKRKAKIINKIGEIIDYPYQKNNTDNPINETPKNYLDYIIKRFGDKDARDFHVPYNDKFWKYPLHKMSADWANTKYVPKKNINGSYGTNDNFWYPSKGYIGNIAEKRYNSLNLQHNHDNVVAFDIKDKTIITNNNKYKYNKCYSSIPLNRINIDWGCCKKYIKRLKHTTIACFNFSIHNNNIKKSFEGLHWIYFCSKEIPFIRISFPSNYGGKTLKGYTTIQCEISINPYDKLKNYHDYAQIMKDIGIFKKIPTFISSEIINIAYCIPTLTVNEDVKKITQYLNKYDIFPIGRYGKWKNLWMHEVMNI